MTQEQINTLVAFESFTELDADGCLCLYGDGSCVWVTTNPDEREPVCIDTSMTVPQPLAIAAWAANPVPLPNHRGLKP